MVEMRHAATCASELRFDSHVYDGCPFSTIADGCNATDEHERVGRSHIMTELKEKVSVQRSLSNVVVIALYTQRQEIL